MRRHAGLLLVILLLLSGWMLVPQHYGGTEAAREPALVVVGTVMDTTVEHSTENPDFTTACTREEFSHALAEEGFTRNPLAKEHKIGNTSSDASWAYRDGVAAHYQTHVILDEGENKTHIYVHREYSYIRHPFLHYKNPHISFDVTAEERFQELMQDNPNALLWQARDMFAASEDCSIEPS